MEFSIKTTVLLISILFTGLTAGLCFTWSNAVTPGIGKLNDITFLQSFQAMNRTIINLSFLTVFFGPTILLFLNVYFFKDSNPNVFCSFLLAAILYFVGVGLVTVFKNVPLNEILDKTVLETTTREGLKDLRGVFEKSWNRWHMIRTVTSLTSFALLLIGIIHAK